MRRLVNIAILLFLTGSTAVYADYKELTADGNEAYRQDDFESALKLYKEAEVESPKQPILDYNIGSVLHQQTRYEEALQRYQAALYAKEPQFQADAYYNTGNTLFRSQQYVEAIQAYQKSLELTPEDIDAKYNLELARKKLKEQAQQEQQKQDQQQQQQEQSDQDQQQQKQQQQQQDQEQQQQQEQEDQQEDQQEEGSEGEEGEQDEQQAQLQQQEEQEGMEKEDAERILNAIAGDEKDLQKKLRKRKVKSSYQGKDW